MDTKSSYTCLTRILVQQLSLYLGYAGPQMNTRFIIAVNTDTGMLGYRYPSRNFVAFNSVIIVIIPDL